MSRMTIFCWMTSAADVSAARFAKTGLWASFLFVIMVVSGLPGCDRGPAVHEFTGSTMGTRYHVKVIANEVPGAIEKGIYEALDAVDRAMSTYQINSELNQLNRQPLGQPFALSDPLYEVLVHARQVYRETGGAFDPSIGPLVDLWGFGPALERGGEVPAEADIDELLSVLGYDGLSIDSEQRTATRNRAVRLDLSAIAKGYGADRAAAYLRQNGFDRFLVEVGGEMVLSGLNGQGRPWQVAIETPTPDRRTVQRVIGLSKGAVATSGDYRNYFEKDGVRYSHTLDPRDGYPIRHALASVTVIADNCAQADALATAFMVMGDQPTLAYAEERDIPVFLLVKAGDGFVEQYSPAFGAYLQEVN